MDDPGRQTLRSAAGRAPGGDRQELEAAAPALVHPLHGTAYADSLVRGAPTA
jgi:hypothetical protein